MNDWKHQHGLSDQDVEEMIDALKIEFITGEISEEDFRRRLAKLGLTATEIDSMCARF